jgi:hypothetical protein
VATVRNPQGRAGPSSRDGLEFAGSEIVAKGSSAQNLLGKFNDKTAIEVGRTGICTSDGVGGYVYFAWSRFTGNGGSNIYLSRSGDHGATWSQPTLLTSSVNDVQVPEITVTGNGHVYLTWVATVGNKKTETHALQYAKSSDCGATFTPAASVVTFEGYAHQDSGHRDCGDADSACPSGYTFFRAETTPRAATDQADRGSENVYIVYDAAFGPDVATGTSYGRVAPGVGSLSAAYYTVLNGRAGTYTAPVPVDPPGRQHQLFPDIAVDHGAANVMWWDSRNDPTCLTATTCADRHVVPGSLDVYASTFSTSAGPTGALARRLTTTGSNPNYEQFGGRTVPFAGDYLWIDSVQGTTYAAWTDWRDTAAGSHPRETTTPGTAEPGEGADVLQCRFTRTDGSISGDTCPRAGGLDQNIYASSAP